MLTLSALTCAATTVAGGSSTSCTVTLSGAAPAAGAAVTLSSSNSAALTVPASVNVGANATSASFTANGNAVTVNQAAVVTATFGGISKTVSLTVAPTAGSSTVFYLKADASELSATTNGAVVTPTVRPQGLTGTLNVLGSGSVKFSAGTVGNGAAFLKGGQQNQNTAFYSFKGPQIQNVFNLSQGGVSFSLKSTSTFTARKTKGYLRYVFDVYDNMNNLFYFTTTVADGRLIFYYNTGGTATQYYYVPTGQEDKLFGSGVALNVKLTWDGKQSYLYLNGALVNTTPYSPASPGWNSTSSLTLGAQDIHIYNGGFFSCDDVIDEFQVQNQ